MLRDLAKNWGWVVARGVVAIVFGVLCFIWPIPTLSALILVYGAFAFADGIASIAAGFAGRQLGAFWPLFLFGVVGVLAGLAAVFWPGLTATVLLLVIASWSIVRGVAEIATAIRLRKVIQGEWLMGLAGLLSIVFGGLVIARPAAGALAIVWLVGWFALGSGIVTLMLGLRLRSLQRAATV